MTAPLFPADPSKGTQTYTVSKRVFIEKSDFSETEVKGFFGVMPGQVVCLRYGPFVQLEEVVKDSSGAVSVVKVKVLADYDKKVKGVIHWVSEEHSLPAICNLYNVLLSVVDVA